MIREIYNYVATKSGKRDETTFLTYLNAAVREMWNKLDPVLDEVAFHTTEPLVTLPWFVEELRAMRSITRDEQMTLQTPRPYYNSVGPTVLPFVTLNSASPLIRSLRTASTLTIRRDIADVAVTVVVSGATRNGSAASTEVVLPLGVKQGETKLAFVAVSSLVRNTQDSCDTDVIDAEGTLVSRIPMDRLEARYQQIRLTDRRFDNLAHGEYFALYYRPVIPYYRRIDSPLDPRLGDIIQNKILEMLMTGSSVEHEANAAAIYGSKTKASLANRTNRTAGHSITINVGNAAHDHQRISRPGRCD